MTKDKRLTIRLGDLYAPLVQYAKANGLDLATATRWLICDALKIDRVKTPANGLVAMTAEDRSRYASEAVRARWDSESY